MTQNVRRTVLWSAAIVALASSGLGPARAETTRTAADDPALTSVEVLYHTNDDNKDHDTKLLTSVRDNRGVEIATLDEHFGDDTFDDNEDDGPYGLRLTNPATLASTGHGRLVVRIEPNGNDTWKFNVFATLFFSDGSRRVAQERNNSLDQDRRQREFEIL
ncbi:hypothetical protein [Actinomadura sp. DC4]|uniref:hypothetical protein n=1 Tax=Actinomadura sp. DC4 TaxID=3055069 RepID=UPI0025B03217|nr:hypothetical protein [Actinomadura sp. DC4]MDN3358817.1 hypothetical protein [Actinomadura sp. DC4]